MAYKRISATLTPDLSAAVERACKQENQTRSKLVRLALRRYLSAPLLPPAILDQIEDYYELCDPQSQADIKASRRDVEAGRVRSAEELLAELEREEAREATAARR